MAAKEQGKPLAPANSYHLRSDEEEVIVSSHIKLCQRKYVMCCGCVSALFLIIAVTAIVLGFTVFHVKSPRIEMNNVTIQQQPEVANGALRSDTNVTLLADVSIKNPNVASFKYGNTTTTGFLQRDGGGPREDSGWGGKGEEDDEDERDGGYCSRGDLGGAGVHEGGGIREVDGEHLYKDSSMTYNFANTGIEEEDCKRRVRL
ncbi:hypothetical protein GBA52_016818 [Prunus armeniaca]|nr:hypothetical protein GBA52_016818 [Prunus armeniaca]